MQYCIYCKKTHNKNDLNEKDSNMYLTLTTQNIIVDDNATEGLDTRFVETGYVFDKTLSTNTLPVEVKPILSLRTIFNGSEANSLEQFLKVLCEYLTHDISMISKGEAEASPLSHYQDVISKTRLVKVMTTKEFTAYVNQLFSSNKALPDKLIEEMLPYATLDLSDVKNKEVKLWMLDELVKKGEYVNGYELIRYINYLMTDDLMYIHKRQEDYIKSTNVYNPSTLDDLEHILSNETYQKSLASVYNNHIKTFIWLRHAFVAAKKNHLARYINQIKRLAKKTKQLDFSVDYHINILSKPVEEQEKIFETKNFSLKELFNMYLVANQNTYYAQQGLKPYLIRNGRLWIGSYTDKNVQYNQTVLLKQLKQKLLDLGEIVLPTEYNLPIQFSDKKKLGDMYFGTGFELQVGDEVGIIWDESVDFDLSFTDYTHKTHYSFYDTYSTPFFSHSGDCRTAGSELIKILNEEALKATGGFYVNLFSGHNKCTFRIIIKRGEQILYQSHEYLMDKSQMFMGYLKDGQFILELTSVNNSNISRYIQLANDKNKSSEHTIVQTGDNYENLNEFLSNRPFIFLKDVLEQLEIPYYSQSIYAKPSEAVAGNADGKAEVREFTKFE